MECADIAELDGGSAAVVSFPDPNDLTTFNVRVTVDTGLWLGASYDFTFKIPAVRIVISYYFFFSPSPRHLGYHHKL